MLQGSGIPWQEAFTEFVRQDLRKDLEPRLAARFPIRYHLLICAAILCASLEFFLALWKAGAPTESILCFAMAIVLGVNGFVVVFISIAANYLSDRFAARRFGCCDHVQTLLILGCCSERSPAVVGVLCMSYLRGPNLASTSCCLPPP